jgi:hypothetical protein
VELVDFLNLKQQKVLGDDLDWLHDSLPEEQRLLMSGSSLEGKRLELMAALGFEDCTSSMLLEACPDEGKGRLKLECRNLEKSIDRIKRINNDILETVEKKLEAAEAFVNQPGAGASKGIAKSVNTPGFYNPTGSKIRMTDPADDIIGKM